MKPFLYPILLALLFPSLAHAQERATTLYVGVGPSVPLGDDLDRIWSTGLAAGGGVALPLSSALRLRGDLAYSRFPLDEDALLALAEVPPDADVDIDGGAASSFTATVLLEASLPTSGTSVRPYLLAGGGYWNGSFERIVVGESSSQVVSSQVVIPASDDGGAAAAVGGGLEVPVHDVVSVFVEGRYVWADFSDPPGSDDTYVPVTVGVTFRP